LDSRKDIADFCNIFKNSEVYYRIVQLWHPDIKLNEQLSVSQRSSPATIISRHHLKPYIMVFSNNLFYHFHLISLKNCSSINVMNLGFLNILILRVTTNLLDLDLYSLISTSSYELLLSSRFTYFYIYLSSNLMSSREKQFIRCWLQNLPDTDNSYHHSNLCYILSYLQPPTLKLFPIQSTESRVNKILAVHCAEFYFL
jgi:hypothetical protein